MRHSTGTTLALLGITVLALVATSPATASEDAPFDWELVGSMYAHGTPVERLWAAYGVLQAPDGQRRRVLAEIGYHLRGDDGESAPPASPDEPEYRPPRVRVRLRSLRTSERQLRDMGIDLAPLLPGSPPYHVTGRAPWTPLHAALEEGDLVRIEDATRSGRMPLVGEGEVVLANTRPGGVEAVASRPSVARIEAGFPQAGAVVHVRSSIAPSLRTTALVVRARVAGLSGFEADAPQGARKRDDGIHPKLAVRQMRRRVLTFRDGESYVLLARSPGFGAWTDEQEVGMILQVEILPPKGPGADPATGDE